MIKSDWPNTTMNAFRNCNDLHLISFVEETNQIFNRKAYDLWRLLKQVISADLQN